MKTNLSLFGKTLFLTLMIALSSISGAMAVNWSGTYGYDAGATHKDNITLTGNTTLSLNNGVTVTIEGVISGNYSLTFKGKGYVVFKGANTYTGKTVINLNDGYYLEIGGSSTTGAIPNSSNVEIQTGGLVFNRTNLYEYSGSISGAGNVSKWSSASELVLSGASTYTGKTAVWGKLTLKGKGVLNNTSEISLETSAAELVLATTDPFAYLIPKITGSGKVTKKESSTTAIFAQDNTYTGITTIEAGYLYIGTGGATGGIASASIVVNSGAMLGFNRNNAYYCTSVISGDGGVAQTGGGSSNTYLNAVNTYTGDTYISSGVLTIGANGSIEKSAGVTFDKSNNGAILAITGTKRIKSLNSTDTKDGVSLQNGTLIIGTNGSTADGGGTFAGCITGTGTGTAIEKQGTSVLKLTGTSEYVGATEIYGPVEFSKAESLGVGGSIKLFTGNTLRWATGNTADISSRLVISGTGGNLDIQSNNVTFASALSTTNSSLPINKTGSGKLYLKGNNTRTGSLNVKEGQLYIGNGYDSQGDWAGPIDVAANCTLFFNRTTTKTYSGVISGDGSVVNLGSGTITLTGNNTFTGPLYVQDAAVTIGNGSTSGSVAASNIITKSNLTFNRNDYTYNGVISGTGGVLHNGPGTLTLNGNNTYTGWTTIGTGTLELGTNGRIENSLIVALLLSGGKFKISNNKTINQLNTVTGSEVILNNYARLTINEATSVAVEENVLGNITGTGSISKTGSKTMTFGGNNTYTGETALYSGKLVLNATGTIAESEAVVLGSDAILDVSSGNKTVKKLYTYYSANEVKLGSGYTLQIGTSTSSADGYGEFAGKFTGTGDVKKTGTQTFNMSGTSNATGTFYLAGGTLLTDKATWSGNFNQSQATILHLKDVFTVGGSLSLNGGSINMDLNASNPSKIVATGVASLANTTGLNISAVTGSYTLIQAKSGLLNSHSNGRFSFPTLSGLTLDPKSSATMLTLNVTKNTPIEDVNQSAERIWASDGVLHLNLAQPEMVKIYNLSGSLVRTFAAPAGESEETLPHGIYIIKTSAKTVKVAH
ncbi:MAG: autotransporter-associated beta strand repeat-containing protein [Dysgonamonadaceae bacterium]|jgi:autotransporter-associated beta strand protein|nr:autotransporter-associated beta strand repeat-containing protein [Dysgonamonadaceae bacterium]